MATVTFHVALLFFAHMLSLTFHCFSTSLYRKCEVNFRFPKHNGKTHDPVPCLQR